MRSIKNRLEELENRNGFKNRNERREYLLYARMLNPDVKADDIRTPDDYIKMAREHFEPIPELT